MAKYDEWITEEAGKPIEFLFKGNEKEYENHIVEHIHEICEGMKLPPVLIVEQQKQVRFDGNQIIMDIVCRHEDDSLTIFEVKKISDRNPHTSTSEQVRAIGQVLLYKNILSALNFNVRVCVIAEKIHKRTLLCFLDFDLPITLIEFQKNKVFIPYNKW